MWLAGNPWAFAKLKKEEQRRPYELYAKYKVLLRDGVGLDLPGASQA